MSAVEKARAALAQSDRVWANTSHQDRNTSALGEAMRALIAEHERVLANPLLATVDLGASVILDTDDLSPATDLDGNPTARVRISKEMWDELNRGAGDSDA